MLLAGNAGGSDDRWQSPQGHGHALAGRIWDVGAARFIDTPTLVEHLSRTRFILLGERHDNTDHHRLQAELLQALIARGRRPAVSFEMFTADDASIIARQLADAPRDADALADAVDWKRSGWPAWPMYRPLVQVALDAGLPVVAGNLSPSVVRGLSESGLDLKPPVTAGSLGLDGAWPPSFQADLTAELRRAHCGQGSDVMLERMALIQRARDARMARSLVEADRGDGAVLIAGAGHVRTDRGVPMQLRILRPDLPVASVAFQEVADDSTEPGAYADTSGARPPFDYVWFTARVDAVDPCERFKNRAAPGREAR